MPLAEKGVRGEGGRPCPASAHSTRSSINPPSLGGRMRSGAERYGLLVRLIRFFRIRRGVQGKVICLGF